MLKLVCTTEHSSVNKYNLEKNFSASTSNETYYELFMKVYT